MLSGCDEVVVPRIALVFRIYEGVVFPHLLLHIFWGWYGGSITWLVFGNLNLLPYSCESIRFLFLVRKISLDTVCAVGVLEFQFELPASCALYSLA